MLKMPELSQSAMPYHISQTQNITKKASKIFKDRIQTESEVWSNPWLAIDVFGKMELTGIVFL